VYVNWITDSEMVRNNTTKESAEPNRKRMKSSKLLLLAISKNAEMSKRIPWELGYVDSHTNRCAIIPVSKKSYVPKVFKGKKYLKSYPFIKKIPRIKHTFEKLWKIRGEYTYSLLRIGIKPDY
jgi:hypothetical protein